MGPEDESGHSVERVVYQNERVEIGAFRCPADHTDFRHAGAPIRDHYVFVFPRSRVWIRHQGGRAFATDTNLVTLYNPGQAFERERLDREGDFCDWFAVDSETAFEAVRALDPSVEDRPGRCFPVSHAPTDARTYLAQRALFEVVARGEQLDSLAVEERVLWLLARVLESAYEAWGRAVHAAIDRAREEPDEPDAVRRARLVLAERFRDPISLAQVARSVGLSRYRLCRVFRKQTGSTLHAYREQLRLRAALAALESPSVDLTGLAIDLGYSSHSHFSANFRRAFGVTPSQARGRLSRGMRQD